MSYEEQAEVNIGLVGHVDHGKTSIVKNLTDTWTDKHSEELKRGITIRIGYANLEIYKCEKCDKYTIKKECECGGKAKRARKISFVDAPGHETLMTVMVSSAAMMDGAMLIIAANEECPQPQTYEHLMALQIVGVNNIVIVQNKVDLVTEEEAKEHRDQIKQFVKGTVAENAPIIPFAAHHEVNQDQLLKAIEKEIPTPERNPDKPSRMYVARSFDVNKPGSEIKDISGGVVGGSLIQGKLEKGDEIQLRPGIEKEDGEWKEVTTKVQSLDTCGHTVKEALPGGLIGVKTDLDPSFTKTDKLTGNILGEKGTLPPVVEEITLELDLMERIVGSEEVKDIKPNEPLVVTVGTATSLGIVKELHPVKLKLKKPLCAKKGWEAAVSRKIGNRWRLIGYGEIK